MKCPKCSQPAVNLDEEGDTRCFMCGYNSATRKPTEEEMLTAGNVSKIRLNGYGPEPNYKGASWNVRTLSESMPLLKRRATDFGIRGTGGRRKKINRKFNGAISGRAKQKVTTN